ncbi:MAG: HAD family acid phosphatase [Salinisphaera sp.]|uniref:HAD family acid phosphatase n=1 Tax=Salinisphaera sp. TaxID=1914330 RepID=UPI003C7C4086
MATRRLDRLLANRRGTGQPAVGGDVNETVLDNSPYQAAGVADGFSYPKHWDQWIDSAQARLIPGARAFLRHADARAVASYYVSNRSAAHEAATIANLQRDDLPQVSTDDASVNAALFLHEASAAATLKHISERDWHGPYMHLIEPGGHDEPPRTH